MKVYILHERNTGTPESNEIISVHKSEKNAFDTGIKHLIEYYDLTREEAILDLEEKVDYAYIESYELKTI